MKKTINTILMIASIVLFASAIIGASLACNYALILLVPAVAAVSAPLYSFVKTINSKFKLNK